MTTSETTVDQGTTDEVQKLREEMDAAIKHMVDITAIKLDEKVNELQEAFSSKIEDLEKYMREDSNRIKHTVH